MHSMCVRSLFVLYVLYVLLCGRSAFSVNFDSRINFRQQSMKSSGNVTTSPKKPLATRSGSTDSTSSTESSASSTVTRSQTHGTSKQTTKPEIHASQVRPRGSIEMVSIAVELWSTVALAAVTLFFSFETMSILETNCNAVNWSFE